ncbi:hypothetical protein Sru01_56200 [Sphaerisporangium rufum]|uniref:Histidine kinase/HSP90-like ATPase domain-containing protein n=1 Tax=Sphaerisporangium rufum TaxID=1381558 RepID=A0A919V3Z6_9ACTN|nr:ATP-binding protein [Sphaerisporangium rufum]GII80638.1 hypothetical protein Sru01_56200 [Sphaerisporangium rufum]
MPTRDTPGRWDGPAGAPSVASLETDASATEVALMMTGDGGPRPADADRVDDAVGEPAGGDTGRGPRPAGVEWYEHAAGGGDADRWRVRTLDRAAFPATEAAVGEARRRLRTLLAGHPRQDDAVLLLSETFTNAVLHTRSAAIGVVVLLGVDGHVQVEVVDQGAATSPCARPDPAGEPAESGRGIHLVRTLAARWGFFAEPGRCVTWFALDRHPLRRTPPGTATEG